MHLVVIMPFDEASQVITLRVPRTRSFTVAGPRFCHSLPPANIRTADILQFFKIRLKAVFDLDNVDCDFVFKCFINLLITTTTTTTTSLRVQAANVQMASLWSRGKTPSPLPETPLSSVLWQTPVSVHGSARETSSAAKTAALRIIRRRHMRTCTTHFPSQSSTRWYANQATLSFLTELTGPQEGFRTRYFLGRPSKTDLTLPLRPTSYFVPTRFSLGSDSTLHCCDRVFLPTPTAARMMTIRRSFLVIYFFPPGITGTRGLKYVVACIDAASSATASALQSQSSLTNVAKVIWLKATLQHRSAMSGNDARSNPNPTLIVTSNATAQSAEVVTIRICPNKS